MIHEQKIQPELSVYFFAAMFVIVLLGRFGRQAIEWALMQLYDFFIGKAH
jgi:hypothetical protein